VLAYFGIIWCSVGVRLHLKSHLKDLPEECRSRELLYTQLDLILVVQALTPLLFELLPTSIMAVGAIAQYETAELSGWMTF